MPEEYEDNEVVQMLDPDSMDWSRVTEFSHASHVSSAYNACISTGRKEMIKGFWQVRIDKWGSQLKEYHADTRQEFINAVETLKNVMIADLDDIAKEKIKESYKKIDELTLMAINSEEAWYNNQSYQTRAKLPHMKGHLNQEGFFSHALISAKVGIYREIFEQLELQLSRTKYLKRKVLTN